MDAKGAPTAKVVMTAKTAKGVRITKGCVNCSAGKSLCGCQECTNCEGCNDQRLQWVSRLQQL